MAIFEGGRGSAGWILQLDEIALDDASETPDPLEGAAETDADAPEATRPRIERLPVVRASYLLDHPVPSRPSTNPRLDSIHRPPRA